MCPMKLSCVVYLFIDRLKRGWVWFLQNSLRFPSRSSKSRSSLRNIDFNFFHRFSKISKFLTQKLYTHLSVSNEEMKNSYAVNLTSVLLGVLVLSRSMFRINPHVCSTNNSISRCRKKRKKLNRKLELFFVTEFRQKCAMTHTLPYTASTFKKS